MANRTPLEQQALDQYIEDQYNRFMKNEPTSDPKWAHLEDRALSAGMLAARQPREFKQPVESAQKKALRKIVLGMRVGATVRLLASLAPTNISSLNHFRQFLKTINENNKQKSKSEV